MLYTSPFITAYCIVTVLLLGLCMGSFLNCLAWRLTHGESVLRGRSHCTSCGHALGVRDLVPVVSWLASGGRCRYCGERISVRYPLAELVCAAGYVSILLVCDLSLEAVELMAFFSVLLVLSLTDLDAYLIPNAAIVSALAIRIAYLGTVAVVDGLDVFALLCGSFVSGLAVAVPVTLLALVMDRMLGRESLGGGDIKLLFVAGCYFGWLQCLLLLVIACVVGITVGLLGSRDVRKTDGQAMSDHLIPFGPALALGCWITMLVGAHVQGWYLSLFW